MSAGKKKQSVETFSRNLWETVFDRCSLITVAICDFHRESARLSFARKPKKRPRGAQLALSLALECRVNELALLTSADIVLVLTLKPGVQLVSILLPWLSLCCAPKGTTISDGPVSVTDVTPGAVISTIIFS